MHVAIIPDGNRRWARQHGLLPTEGHRRAIHGDRITAFLDEAISLGLSTLSLWAFSTENWKRSRTEVAALFRLLRTVLADFSPVLHERGVRLVWAGRRDRVPADVRERLERLEEETRQHATLTFILCLDYGGRDEIVRGVRRLVERGEEVTEESLAGVLDTAGLSDPDLIIRRVASRGCQGCTRGRGRTPNCFLSSSTFLTSLPPTCAVSLPRSPHGNAGSEGTREGGGPPGGSPLSRRERGEEWSDGWAARPGRA